MKHENLKIAEYENRDYICGIDKCNKVINLKFKIRFITVIQDSLITLNKGIKELTKIL
jgi:hypothetical protein